MTLLQALKMRRERQEYANVPLVQFLAGYYQERVAEKIGVELGGEFRGAFEEACAQGVPVVLFDRRLSITTQRAKDVLTRWDKVRLFFELLGGIFWLPGEDEIARILTDQDKLRELMETLGKRYPTLKRVIIDERDRYMMYKLHEFSKNCRSVVAIVGAGHIPGICRIWDEEVTDADMVQLSQSSQHRRKTVPISFVLNARK
eukprot:scaffold942_cov260-Pinguiococcus_pyrenoidosus.AAC.19